MAKRIKSIVPYGLARAWNLKRNPAGGLCVPISAIGAASRKRNPVDHSRVILKMVPGEPLVLVPKPYWE